MGEHIMALEQGEAPKPQAGWKVGVGIVAFMAAVILLLWLIKTFIGM
jgi:hypothetical protein